MSENELLYRFLDLEDETQPLELWRIYEIGELTPEAAKMMVTEVWKQPNFPLSILGAEKWATLFEFAGYTEDGVVADRPSTELTLFRGSLAENREGFSWTEELGMAENFTRPRFDGHAKTEVWTAVVPPHRLLARISAEREFVVDSRGLKITLVHPSRGSMKEFMDPPLGDD